MNLIQHVSFKAFPIASTPLRVRPFTIELRRERNRSLTRTRDKTVKTSMHPITNSLPFKFVRGKPRAR